MSEGDLDWMNANQGWTGCDKMTYFFKETKTNIVNLLFITDSYRICQKLRDLKAFQVTFKCNPPQEDLLKYTFQKLLFDV
jgi:hypothetical protein